MRLFLLAIVLGLTTAVFAGRLELITSVPLERARHVGFQGDYAWVAQNIEGAALLDIGNPKAPKLVKQFSPEEMQPLYFRLLPDENLMVSADRFRGLVVYDVSVPDSPTTVSVLPLTGMTTHLDLVNTTDGLRLAVLARAGEGLLCVDITDPAQPHVTDSFTLGIDFTRAVAVADGIVYAADSREGGLKALRLLSPGRFEPLYQATLFGPCWSLTVHERHLLAGYFSHGFKIFELPELTDAAAGDTTPILKLVSSALRNRSMVRAIVPAGSSLVVANEQIGIDLYHIEKPALPWLGDEYLFKSEPDMQAQSCAVYRDLVFVPAWDAGLMILRISEKPTLAEFNLENVDYVAEPER